MPEHKAKFELVTPTREAKAATLAKSLGRGATLVAWTSAQLRAHKSVLPSEEEFQTLLFGQWAMRVLLHAGFETLPLPTEALEREALRIALQVVPGSSLAPASRYSGLLKACLEAISDLRWQGVAWGQLAAPSDKMADISLVAQALEQAQLGVRRQALQAQLSEALQHVPQRLENLEPAVILVGGDWPPLAEAFADWAVRHGAKVKLLKDRTPETASSKLRFVTAQDPLSEAEFAVKEIKALPPGSQAAILLPNAQRYADLLLASAARYGFSLGVPRRAPLIGNGWIRFLVETLDALSQPDVGSLAATLQSSYLNLEMGSRSALIDAVRRLRKRGVGGWEKLRAESGGQTTLACLLDWRAAHSDSASRISEWVGAVAALRDELKTHDEAAPATLERDSRAHTVLNRALSARASLESPESPRHMRLEQFAGLIRQIATEEDVSLPAEQGHISVVSSIEETPWVDHLWVLGASEGVFPRRRSEHPILFDADKEALNAALGCRLQTSVQVANQEREEFQRLLSRAANIRFCYSKSSEDGGSLPSAFVAALCEANGAKFEEPNLEHETVQVRPISDQPLSDAARDILRAKRQPPESIRELRDALECGFRFQARKLGLRSTQLQSWWRRLSFLPEAAELGTAPTQDYARLRLLQALEGELDESLAQLLDWELHLLREGGRRLIEEWVEREFAAREIWEHKDTRGLVPFESLDRKAGEGQFVRGRFGGSSIIGRQRVYRVYGAAAPKVLDQPSDTLFIGLHLMMAFEKGAFGVEFEGMGNKRTLYIHPRPRIPIRQNCAIEDLDLTPQTAPQFFRKVKDLRKEALAKIEAQDLTPTPGDHCRRCDFGELCRRHLAYGEAPFLKPLEDADDLG